MHRPLPRPDALKLLLFAASFLWADLAVDPREQAFFVDLATELGFASGELPEALAILATPPAPDQIDPTSVPPELAARVRDVALRAIAADGRVAERELEMFDALDALLPDAPVRA